MKIFWKKTMLEKLDDIIHQARLDDKKIEKIVMTTGEFEKFKSDIIKIAPFEMVRDCDGATYDGVNIEVEKPAPVPTGQKMSFHQWLLTSSFDKGSALDDFQKLFENYAPPKPGPTCSKQNWKLFANLNGFSNDVFGFIWNQYENSI